MRRRIWWGGMVGITSGLAMLACALVLAELGQPICLRPFSALAPGASVHTEAGAGDPAVLATGMAFHEVVAVLMGLLGVQFAASWRPRYTAPLWLVGGSLVMELVDRAVLAWRMPQMPMMLSVAQMLPYLVFGMVLSTTALGLSPARLIPATGSSLAVRAMVPARPVPLGVVVDRPVLQVLIAPHCFGCERAQGLATEAQVRFPNLAVQVVDLERSTAPLPPSVVAVPAYILDGRLLFTGNPTAEALDKALTTAAVAARTTGE